MRYSGLALRPSGWRQQSLEAVFGRLLNENLENRALDFDGAAATEAELLALLGRKKRLLEMRDT